MQIVAAAVDASAATRNVIAVANAFAHLVDADVLKVHVAERDDGRLPSIEALAAGDVEELEGDVGAALVEYAQRPDVVAMVIGSRAIPAGGAPLGHVATHVATNVAKPLIVVPPHARVRPTIERMLVPLESNLDSAVLHQPAVAMAAERGLDLVIAHVMTIEEIPPFSNHGGYSADAWREEFARRYAPLAPRANVELRIGTPPDLISEIADLPEIDLVAVAWSQDLSPERAEIVRRLLTSCRHPLLLLPVPVAEPVLDLRRADVETPIEAQERQRSAL